MKFSEIRKKIEESIAYKILRSVLYAFVALLLIVIIVQRVSNNNLSIGGFRVFMIVSESMKGEYDIGDILISKKVGPDKINVGDNVTYLGEEKELKGLIITHKVVSKYSNNGQAMFVTKGLANSVEDPEINYDQIYGKVVYKTCILSFIAKLMNNKLTYYILFTMIALIMSIEITSAIFEARREEREENDGRKK
jgi:signal peptidase